MAERVKRCKACVERKRAEIRQIRVYAARKQWRFDTSLCSTCWGGLFDLLVESSDSYSDGIWNPVLPPHGRESERVNGVTK